jgi:Ran GTPase-activating protein (RanGAP) involved in mRNA processing and transport
MKIVINQAINNNQCTELRLISNQIISSGASILADTLLNNRTLELLSLWNNQVGDRGVQSLSNALSINRSTLKKLDLSQNDVTDEGARHLAQMLKTNKILTHLTLSNNKISNEGVQLLADALQNRNNTLKKLSLTQNKLLSDASVDFLLNMFKHNRSLEKLWVDDCNLSTKGKDRLKNATKSKKDFQLRT